MAYVVGEKSGSAPGSSTVTTLTFTPPANIAGDYIEVFAAFRASGTIAVAGSGAFTGIGTQQNTGPWYNRPFYFKVSSPETSITISKGGSAAGLVYICRVIRDVDASTYLSTSTGINSGTASAANLASPTPTPADAGCLISHYCVWDQAYIIADPAGLNLTSAANYSAGTGVALGGVTYESGSGSPIASFNWLASNGTHGANAWAIPIKNKASGTRPTILTDGRSVIRNYGGFVAPTYAAPDTVVATINSIAMSSGSISPTSDKPTTGNWITQGAGVFSVENLGTKAWVGVWDTNPGTLNISGKNIVVPFGIGGTFDGTRVDVDGLICVFADASNNYVAYQLMSQGEAVINLSKSFTKFIRPGATSAYGSAGTLDWTAVTKIGYFYPRLTGTTTSVGFYIGRIHYESAASVIVGGNATNPITAEWAAFYLSAGGAFPDAVSFQGSGQLVDKLSLTYGDGTAETYTSHLGDSVEYPSSAAKLWGLGASAVTRSVKASASDTLSLSGAIMRTATRQAFTIDAASSSSAALNLQNASFLGPWDFADNKGVSFSGTLFNGCYKVVLGAATYSSLTVNNTADTVAVSVAASGATISGSTIDVTGTSADYHLELGTAVTAITLTDVTFTGTPGTDKVHVLKASGTVTITISGTTALVAGDVTSAGATVVIAAPSPTLDATVLANTRVVLYNRTADAEISNTLVAGTSWTHTVTSGASSGDVLDLYTFKEGYQESVATIIYTGADATFAVQQAVDDAVDYYRTAESITDYTTLTEFNFYAPDIYIQSDDADGATSLKRMFIFYNGALTTEDGARYMRGGVTFRSAFDVVINRSVVPMAVDNVSATLGLYFTDESVIRVTTDDGTSWIAPPSAPGSIRYAFGVSPGQIETGVSGLTGPESAQLMGLSTDVNVVSVAGVSVGGTGTTIDPWGPA